MKKHVLFIALAVSMLLSFAATPVFAGADIAVVLDGERLSFDVPPQIVNSRTLVPLRAIFTAMGASIEWDGDAQTVTAMKDSTEVILTIGSSSPTIDGEVVSIDQPGVIIDGRTLAPLRFVAEAFGGSVVWDASSQTASISMSGAAAAIMEPGDTSPSGILRVRETDQAPSSVRVHHVADSLFNQPELVSYELADLSAWDSYHEFVDSYPDVAGIEDVASRIAFIADTAVTGFRYLAIETVFEGGDMGIVVGDTLYELDTLAPEEPFVVNWISIGDVGMFRAISFTEANGNTRCFAFNISGEDGDVYMVEFE